jgi:hypothetical protein
MVGATSRKTLWYLKSTLNHSYGLDYDFSATEADDFAVEPNYYWVKNFIDSTLTAALSSKFDSHVRQQVLFLNLTLSSQLTRQETCRQKKQVFQLTI